MQSGASRAENWLGMRMVAVPQRVRVKHGRGVARWYPAREREHS
jgi:hypothetical protein